MSSLTLHISDRKKGLIQHRISGKQTRIGTGMFNDITVTDSSVSRKHCTVKSTEKGWWIEDLGSMNGTWINDDRIISYGPLKKSDTLRVGSVIVDIELGQEPSGEKEEPKRDKPHQTNLLEDGVLTLPAENSFPDSEASLVLQESTNSTLMSTETAALFLSWQKRVHRELIGQMDLRRKNLHTMTDEEVRYETHNIVGEVVKGLAEDIPAMIDQADLVKSVIDEAIGLGPLEELLEDESVTEIMVNNPSQVFVERAGQITLSPKSFSSNEAVLAAIDRIITRIGRRIDESMPMVDARLIDGSRVNAIIPPVAIQGPCITIRKFSKKRLEFSDLVKFGSMNAGMVDFLKICVHHRKNIIVSGGTGTGKTTLLNVLSNEIPKDERVITVEDSAELRLNMDNLVSLEARPANSEGKGEIAIRDLVKNALRMRPDRIVVGECRGGEALDMLQAMNTGHDGSLTTAHANSPRDAISRMEVMVMMSGMDLPVQAIREQISSAVDIIIQQTRYPCGSRKVTSITEVSGIESGVIQMQEIFRFRQIGVDDNKKVLGKFEATGFIPDFYEELDRYGFKVDRSIFDKLEQSSEFNH